MIILNSPKVHLVLLSFRWHGGSPVAFTMDVYSHIIGEMQRDTMGVTVSRTVLEKSAILEPISRHKLE